MQIRSKTVGTSHKNTHFWRVVKACWSFNPAFFWSICWILFLLPFRERTETFYPSGILNLDQIELVQLSSSCSINFYFVTSISCYSLLSSPVCPLCLAVLLRHSSHSVRWYVIYIHTCDWMRPSNCFASDRLQSISQTSVDAMHYNI